MTYIAELYSRSKYLSNNLTLVTFLPPALPLESFLEPDSFSDREWWRTLVTLEQENYEYISKMQRHKPGGNLKSVENELVGFFLQIPRRSTTTDCFTLSGASK